MSQHHHSKIKDFESNLLNDLKKHDSLTDVILQHPRLRIIFISLIVFAFILSLLETTGTIKNVFVRSGDYSLENSHSGTIGKNSLTSPEEYAHYKYEFSDRATSPGYEKVQKYIEMKNGANSKKDSPKIKDIQFIAMAFDGSYSHKMWDKTLNFTEELKKQNIPAYFTYFINASYFLEGTSTLSYTPPGGTPGTSAIGFGESKEDVHLRSQDIKRAVDKGHEIGSHSVGHFDGSNWSEDEWTYELVTFKKIMRDVLKREVGPAFGDSFNTTGFRAPNLGVNKSLYEVLKKLNYSYDASGIESPSVWPYKDKNGLWRAPLPSIYLDSDKSEPPVNSWSGKKAVLAMDYSIYVVQTNSTNMLHKETEAWKVAYDSLLRAYMEYFEHSYNGSRAPVYVANHFSAWNDSLYWEVQKAFARKVCGMPDVYCGTHRDLINYIKQTQI